MERLNTGWTPYIKAKLAEYGLEENLEAIKAKSRTGWKKDVEAAVNSVNRKMLRNECFETKLGVTKAKTKTSFLIDKIDSDDYERRPMNPIQRLTRQETKTLILSRFRMLECGKNFKGSLPETCPACNVTDDEYHRLNFCTRFRKTNLSDSVCKVNFDDIFSNDFAIVKKTLCHIEKLWNPGNVKKP